MDSYSRDIGILVAVQKCLELENKSIDKFSDEELLEEIKKRMNERTDLYNMFKFIFGKNNKVKEEVMLDEVTIGDVTKETVEEEVINAESLAKISKRILTVKENL